MENPTVFISAYRNVSIRYILYSKVLDYLKNKDLRIVIFLKDGDLDYYRDKLSCPNIIFEPVRLKQSMAYLRSSIGIYLNLIRVFMYGSKGGFKNNSPEVWKIQYDKEFFTANVINKIKYRIVRLLSSMGNHSLLLRSVFVYIESKLFNGKIYDLYFEKYHPGLLIVSSTGYMIDPFIMRSAKRNNCKVLSILHSWDNPTCKPYRGCNPDFVVAWSEIMKRELNIFQDISEDKIYVGGVAHWDVYFNGASKKNSRSVFVKNHSFDESRKIIFYAASAPKTFRKTFEIVEYILNEISNNRLVISSQLLVRLHPFYLSKGKNGKGQIVDIYRKRIEKIKSKFGDLVSFSLPEVNILTDDVDLPIEDIQNLGEILSHSDLLLTEYSTLMIEGSIFNVPVINVALHKFRDTDKPVSVLENLNHIRRVIDTGATRQVYDCDQLINQINTYLRNPDLDKENRERLVKQEISTNQGNAGESIGRFIYSLIGSG